MITPEPRTILITGASDGIGAAAAIQLSDAGHRVVVVGRSTEKTRAVAEASRAVASFTADFADLAQVRRLGADLREACPRIDVLANNAGGVFPRGRRSVDGLPLTMQINHLAPFLLTHALLDVLLDSGASVVNTSSMAALAGHVLPGDLDGVSRRRPGSAYSNAKLSNIIFTRGLHRKYSGHGLSSVAFHPGVVATSFGSTSGGVVAAWYGSGIGRRSMITAEQGGKNLAHFASGTPGQDWEAGQFYGDRWKKLTLPRQAADDAIVDAHWELSARLVGVTA